jgi:hypothetical protein
VSVVGGGRNRGKVTNLVEKSLSIADIGDAPYLTDTDQVQVSSFNYLDFSGPKPTMANAEICDGDAVTGGVRVMVPATIPSNGNFELTVQFSANELLMMAIEATKDWPVEYLLGELGRSRGLKDVVLKESANG